MHIHRFRIPLSNKRDVDEHFLKLIQHECGIHIELLCYRLSRHYSESSRIGTLDSPCSGFKNEFVIKV